MNEDIKKYIPEGVTPDVRGRFATFEVKPADIQSVCRALFDTHGLPLKTMFAADERASAGAFKIFYVFGIPEKNMFIAPYIALRGVTDYPSMTGVLAQTAFYEREIKEFFGLNPIGHPAPHRWLLHNNWPEGVYPLRKDFNGARPAEAETPYHFQEVKGEGIFEIPVGPVHAGIIEPGHFRFSMAGEEIIALEPRLGFVHKGIEKLFEAKSLAEKVLLAEHVSGDTSFTHGLAFCEAVEQLAGIAVPERAQYLRVIFSELERLTAHVSDVGLIMIGTAFNFGSSQGARLREVLMQLQERLSGSRFLRGLNAVGGITKDISVDASAALLRDLDYVESEFRQLMQVVDNNLAVFNRLSGSGVLPTQTAKDLGAVGVAAKGSGIAVDSRKDFPYAAYGKLRVESVTESTGDVRARFYVRVREAYASLGILREALKNIPAGPIAHTGEVKLKPSSYAIGIAEGWRGDIVYAIATDAAGAISRVHVRDASFLNWPLFMYLAPGNVVLDFPLMNKSQNLSYSGNDK